MTDTTDDMRTGPDFEAEAYRLRGRVAELEARVAELQGSLDRAVVDRRFLIDSMRRCWVALGKWDDGPRDAT